MELSQSQEARVPHQSSDPSLSLSVDARPSSTPASQTAELNTPPRPIDESAASLVSDERLDRASPELWPDSGSTIFLIHTLLVYSGFLTSLTILLGAVKILMVSTLNCSLEGCAMMQNRERKYYSNNKQKL